MLLIDGLAAGRAEPFHADDPVDVTHAVAGGGALADRSGGGGAGGDAGVVTASAAQRPVARVARPRTVTPGAPATEAARAGAGAPTTEVVAVETDPDSPADRRALPIPRTTPTVAAWRHRRSGRQRGRRRPRRREWQRRGVWDRRRWRCAGLWRRRWWWRRRFGTGRPRRLRRRWRRPGGTGGHGGDSTLDVIKATLISATADHTGSAHVTFSWGATASDG